MCCNRNTLIGEISPPGDTKNIFSNHLLHGERFMDAVLIGSILSVAGAVIILVVLAVRVIKLINTTHSEK